MSRQPGSSWGGVVEADQALSLLVHGLEPEAVGVLAGRPVLAGRLEDDQAPDRFGAISHRVPCVLIGVAGQPLDSPAVGVFDVLLAAGAAAPPPWPACRDEMVERVAALIAAIESSPAAAVTLTQVLRAGSEADPAEGLVIES